MSRFSQKNLVVICIYVYQYTALEDDTQWLEILSATTICLLSATLKNNESIRSSELNSKLQNGAAFLCRQIR